MIRAGQRRMERDSGLVICDGFAKGIFYCVKAKLYVSIHV